MGRRFTDFRAVCLPYCLQRQEDGRYVVLNRDYKPLGFFTEEWIAYDQYPIAMRIVGLNDEVARQISPKYEGDLKSIFLYDDKTNPIRSVTNLESYLKRLAVLMQLEVVDDDSYKGENF